MRIIRYLIILGLLQVFLSCSGSKIDIENLPSVKVWYDELPDTVQKIYKKEAEEIKKYREICISTNFKDSCKLNKYTMKNIFELVSHGFVYEFEYKNKTYRLEANKGDPFIFDDEYFYYTEELNLDESNYMKINYIKVEL